MNDNEKKLRKSIGKKIRLARNKTDYTQEKLAEKLSLSTRYISQLERGLAFGSASTIVNLCKALNINSDFLFNDLINCKSPSVTDIVDTNFLENYMNLNEYNKKVVIQLTTNLLKLQENSSTHKNKKHIN